MLDWESLFKRYVWDSRTTPYFVPVPKLTRRQSDYEVQAYCLFTGVLFAVLALASLGEIGPLGRSPLAAAYSFTLVCAAVLLHYTKGPVFAIWLGVAPLALLFAVIFLVPDDKRERMDSALVGLVLMALAWYSWRLYRIARHYPNMREGDAPSPRRRLFK